MQQRIVSYLVYRALLSIVSQYFFSVLLPHNKTLYLVVGNVVATEHSDLNVCCGVMQFNRLYSITSKRRMMNKTL